MSRQVTPSAIISCVLLLASYCLADFDDESFDEVMQTFSNGFKQQGDGFGGLGDSLDIREMMQSVNSPFQPRAETPRWGYGSVGNDLASQAEAASNDVLAQAERAGNAAVAQMQKETARMGDFVGNMGGGLDEVAQQANEAARQAEELAAQLANGAGRSSTQVPCVFALAVVCLVRAAALHA